MKTIFRDGLDSFKIPVRDFIGHTEAVSALACASGRSFLVSGSIDGTVRVWSPENLLHVFIGHSSGVSAVAISPDMRYIASGSRELLVWDMQTLDLAFSMAFTTHVNDLLCMDDRLVACFEDGSLLVLQLGTWTTLFSQKMDNALTSLAVDPNGKILAVGSRGDSILIFDMGNYTTVDSISIAGGSVSVSFSSDRQFLAIAGRNGKIHLWDRKTDELHQRKTEGSLPIRSLTFSSNGSLLVGAGISGNLQVWNGTADPYIIPVGNSPINTVIITENGGSFVVGSDDGSIFIYSAKGTLKSHFPGQKRVSTLTSDGNLLAAGIQQSTLHVWDLKSMKHGKGAKEDGWINSISISPMGDYVATGSKDNLVRLWNVKTLGLNHTFIGHHLPVKSVAFSPDGSLLASGSSDRTVRIWDVSSKKPLKVLEVSQWVKEVSFSKDGTVVATRLITGEVHRWSADTFAPNQENKEIVFSERKQWIGNDFKAIAVAETIILETKVADRFPNPTNWIQSSSSCFSLMA